MKPLKERKIYYACATWHDSHEELEQLMIEAHRCRPATAERTFKLHDYELQGISFRRSRGNALIEVTKSYPGQSIGLVPAPTPRETGVVDEAAPPAGKDFLTGEVFVLLAGNHVLCLPNEGASEYTAYEYIRRMLEKLGTGGFAKAVTFQHVANLNARQLIHQEGVKSVRLNVSTSKASDLYHQERESQKQRRTFSLTKLGASVAKTIRDLFAENPNYTPSDVLQAQENVRVKIELSWDQRRKGAMLGSQVVEGAAEVLAAAESDGFTIVTKGGKKLTHDHIRLHKVVSVKPKGNSVQPHDAFAKLREYYDELAEHAVLIE